MPAAYGEVNLREAFSMNTHPLAANKRTMGDAAVDGLLAGVAAGAVMVAYLLIVGLVQGQVWTAILAQFDPGPAPLPFTGALTHLAVAGVYGALFGVALWLAARAWPALPAWLAGLGYGLALWLLAATVISVRAGDQWLAGIAPVHFGVAHLAYGLALGLLIRRLHH
jgi:hypothetical protein